MLSPSLSFIHYSPKDWGILWKCTLYSPMFLNDWVINDIRNVQSQTTIVLLGTGSKVTVMNDGGLYLTRQGEYTGSNRYGTVPLLSLEVGIHTASHLSRVDPKLG